LKSLPRNFLGDNEQLPGAAFYGHLGSHKIQSKIFTSRLPMFASLHRTARLLAAMRA
jgi:hypothetical protein